MRIMTGLLLLLGCTSYVFAAPTLDILTNILNNVVETLDTLVDGKQQKPQELYQQSSYPQIHIYPPPPVIQHPYAVPSGYYPPNVMTEAPVSTYQVPAHVSQLPPPRISIQSYPQRPNVVVQQPRVHGH